MSEKNNYLIPLSIIIAGGLIASGLYFGAGKTVDNSGKLSNNSGNTENNRQAKPTNQVADETSKVIPVSEDDHIKGNPNAKVFVVEYSDYECPFCKRFHNSMNSIINKYGKTGEVAWVFRHFPLDQLHPKNSRKVAVASECVAEIGGNDAFWKFTDGFMKVTPANDRTDLDTVLPQLYKEVGVDAGKVEDCIASGKYVQHVQSEIDNAVATGGRGTPWSVVIGADGKTYPLNGAQPQSTVEQIIKIAGGNI